MTLNELFIDDDDGSPDDDLEPDTDDDEEGPDTEPDADNDEESSDCEMDTDDGEESSDPETDTNDDDGSPVDGLLPSSCRNLHYWIGKLRIRWAKASNELSEMYGYRELRSD